ncbi:MAG: 1-deoxy-D-xylulose-5-phosphate reductoisomerase [Bdellovibrionota bacterium]
MSAHSLAVLGSTGSIGVQTLDVVRRNPGAFRVAALAAGSNIERLTEQIDEFKPELVVVSDESSRERLRQLVPKTVEIACGKAGLEAAACTSEVQTVVNAVVGFAGLFPAVSAVSAGKNLALANKECLVAGGSILVERARRSGARIAPVDSEHSSVFQCLKRNGCKEQVRRVILTASGGPFRNCSPEQLESVTPEDAVKHPTWSMGAKISVDSATLMNKGLEVIEAAVLFDLPGDKIEVLVHPESIVHGFVEFQEGTLLAALFSTDMRVPITYALKYLLGDSDDTPQLESGVSFLDLAARGTLSFARPDVERFPALSLCYQALATGGQMPLVLNAANEIAVAAFLQGTLKFTDIPRVCAATMEAAPAQKTEDLEGIIAADAHARSVASKLCEDFRTRKPLPR